MVVEMHTGFSRIFVVVSYGLAHKGQENPFDTPQVTDAQKEPFMQRIISGFTGLPSYLEELLTGPYLIYVVLTLFVFLVVLFFNGNVARILRELFVLGIVVTAVVAWFKKNYSLIWLCAAVLLILFVYRLLVYSIRTIRQMRINHRIEKKALENAQLRRGARKRSYIDDRSAEQGEKAVSPDGSEQEDEAFPDSTADEENAPAASGSVAGELSRSQVFDAIRKLTELKDAGILTEEELNHKKSELYSRLK